MPKENEAFIQTNQEEVKMPSPRESQELLMNEISLNGGLSVQEVLDLEKNKNLWFGGRGVIGILIRKMGLGYIDYDETINKFIKPHPVK